MEFKLIVKKINNTLTKEEESILNDWLAESESHRTYFAQVQKGYSTSPDTIDIQRGWDELSGKINPKVKSTAYWKYVAAVAAILVLGALPFYLNKDGQDVKTVPVVVTKEAIEIGSDKATLTLEDGSQVVLEKGEPYEANNISSNGEQLVYKAKENSTKIAHNVLTIPRGGQFFLTLSDGTKVWLNSESQLRYPVSFADDMPRKVELLYGEAYFDVSSSSKNNNTHFVVGTQEQEIDVLGTEFNIKAYKEDAFVATTLVEGKVVVKKGESSKNLTPGTQSQVYTEMDEISIVEVDVANEISWKDGFFSFKNKPLKEIMLVLSRWYDVEVAIENNELENMEFNGVFNKKQSIDSILIIIESTNEAKFETIGKTVIVKK